ncbi:hypothetical protein Bbelb_412530 [Branchiostoma belcheri]|nr:hypothetical protein Bbelb_412530 [Branchiostoma belcheri]
MTFSSRYPRARCVAILSPYESGAKDVGTVPCGSLLLSWAGIRYIGCVDVSQNSTRLPPPSDRLLVPLHSSKMPAAPNRLPGSLHGAEMPVVLLPLSAPGLHKPTSRLNFLPLIHVKLRNAEIIGTTCLQSVIPGHSVQWSGANCSANSARKSRQLLFRLPQNKPAVQQLEVVYDINLGTAALTAWAYRHSRHTSLLPAAVLSDFAAAPIRQRQSGSSVPGGLVSGGNACRRRDD